MVHAQQCLKAALQYFKIITKDVFPVLLATFYKGEYAIKNIQIVSFTINLLDNVVNVLKIIIY